jgi:hypothetical protein
MADQEYPYDGIDLCFMIGTAIYPPLVVPAFFQYLARRSPAVQELLETQWETRALPLRAKLLPVASKENVLEPATAANKPIVLPAQRLFDVLEEAVHLLVIGHTGGGKTVLIHEFACHMAELGNEVVVADPDAAPGQWPGCSVVGHGDDYLAITQKFVEIAASVKARRQARAHGQRSFPSLYLVVDEVADVMRECEMFRALFEDIARRGRKINVHLVAGVQDKLVKTLKLEGQSDLRKNFVTVELRFQSSRRTATITEYEDGRTFVLPVPALRNPEDLIITDMGKKGDVEFLKELLTAPPKALPTPPHKPSVERFAQDMLQRQEGNTIGARDLYGKYEDWAHQRRVAPENITNFGLALKRLGFNKNRTAKGYIEYEDLAVVS